MQPNINEVERYLTSHSIEQIIAYLEEQLAKFPDSNYLKGIYVAFLYQREDQQPALDYLATITDRENTFIQNALGFMLKWDDNLEDSVPFFEKAIALDKRRENIWPLINLAEIYSEEGDYRKGLKLLDQFLTESETGAGTILLNYAAILLENGEIEQALEAAVSIDEDDLNETILNFIGELSIDVEDAEQARKYFERSLALKPTPEAWNGLSLAYELDENWEAGLAAAEQAMSLAPNDALYVSTVGIFLSHLEREEEALAYYNRAIALEPTLEDYQNKIISLQTLERFDEALKSIGECKTLLGESQLLGALAITTHLLMENEAAARQLIDAYFEAYPDIESFDFLAAFFSDFGWSLADYK